MSTKVSSNGANVSTQNTLWPTWNLKVYGLFLGKYTVFQVKDYLINLMFLNFLIEYRENDLLVENKRSFLGKVDGLLTKTTRSFRSNSALFSLFHPMDQKYTV